MSLQSTEAECAANAIAPRVSLADIQGEISECFHVTADQAVGRPGDQRMRLLTICIVVMRNGFIVVGKSAPASADNFNAELGKKLAYEDCIRQLWPLMGFALRDKLHNAQEAS